MRRLFHALGLLLAIASGLAASVAIGSASTRATTSTTSTTTTTTSSTTSTTTQPVPANTKLPTISGTARDGSLLTARRGSWTHSPTSFAYEWLRCDVDGNNCATIASANSQRYTVTVGDVGHRLRVRVTATNRGGSTAATSDVTAVVQAAGNAPANTSAPSISGTPQDGQRLTVNHGRWSGTQPISFSYSWQRCDGAGANCATFINQSGQTSYTLTSADVGHTIRVQVNASNARGSSSATSSQTALVVAAKPATGALSVSQVSLPDRLVIDGVTFSPSPIRSRTTTVVARFHVSETDHGRAVQGALVYALGLPYGWVYPAQEQATDGSGWATILIHPTRNLPLRRGDLVVFVRARKPGDNLLAGVSTRRLVQVGIG
jgi:hypothetical protein